MHIIKIFFHETWRKKEKREEGFVRKKEASKKYEGKDKKRNRKRIMKN